MGNIADYISEQVLNNETAPEETDKKFQKNVWRRIENGRRKNSFATNALKTAGLMLGGLLLLLVLPLVVAPGQEYGPSEESAQKIAKVDVENNQPPLDSTGKEEEIYPIAPIGQDAQPDIEINLTIESIFSEIEASEPSADFADFEI
ncbi:MAG: hypothetical protein ACOCXP_00245 [Candidatus Dojkabacteria bacterium]